jgi:ferric-dicitrate binding protein FerR (iron transport regulator)
VARPVVRPVVRPVAARRPGRARLAAGVAIAAAIGRWTERDALRPASATSAPERKTTEYATGPGQRALVQLADGTQIALAPESRLRFVQPVADSGVRDAYLVGEAVFTVAHDPARPFVVHAKDAATVDVGTRFGVRAYPDAPLRVAVAEGRVALADDVPGAVRVDSSLASLTALPRATLLAAGDVAARTDDGTETVTRNVDVDALLGWATGRLTFDHVPLRALVPDLERWYGLTIHVATPSLLDQRVSGSFESESRDDIVAALARVLGARAERHGATVTFTR